NNSVIGATFYGRDSNLSVLSIAFKAPTNTSKGQSVLIPRAVTGNTTDPKNGLNHGLRYTLQDVDKLGHLHAYTGIPPNGLTVTIQYQLPDDGHMKATTNPDTWVSPMTATLHAADLDGVLNNQDC